MSQDSFVFTYVDFCRPAEPPLSPSFHPQSFMSDFRSLPGGRTQFSRCCDLIIDLGSDLFDGSSSFSDTYSAEHEKPSRILVCDGDLFLPQKIEIRVTAGTGIHDGGDVPGKIVEVTARDAIGQGKSKGDLQRDLGRPNELSVPPGLTVNRDFTTGSNGI